MTNLLPYSDIYSKCSPFVVILIFSLSILSCFTYFYTFFHAFLKPFYWKKYNRSKLNFFVINNRKTMLWLLYYCKLCIYNLYPSIFWSWLYLVRFDIWCAVNGKKLLFNLSAFLFLWATMTFYFSRIFEYHSKHRYQSDSIDVLRILFSDKISLCRKWYDLNKLELVI